MKKKILIDLERLRYPNSGIANVFRNLATGLLEKNAQFELFFFGKKEQLEKFEPKPNCVFWNKTHRFFERFSGEFDLIHVSHQLSSYFHRNYKNTIKIVTLHDLNFLYENLTDSKKRKMLGKVRSNVKNADYIVCISEYAKQSFIRNKRLFTFTKLKDIVVIHNGIHLPENREYQLGKYSYLKDQKYILNIGVLFNKKNQLTLVEMLPYIEEDLVLIASDEKQPYADEVRQRIKELHMEQRVHFLRNLSEEEKYAVIQHSEAMCHPSIAEGFGIPPIEAMAFGKPVFLSTYTSLPEIGGDKAFYFDSFEPKAMAKLYLEKMDLYHSNEEAMSQDIKKWTEQYSYTAMSNNYLKFYESVLKES